MNVLIHSVYETDMYSTSKLICTVQLESMGLPILGVWTWNSKSIPKWSSTTPAQQTSSSWTCMGKRSTNLQSTTYSVDHRNSLECHNPAIKDLQLLRQASNLPQWLVHLILQLHLLLIALNTQLMIGCASHKWRRIKPFCFPMHCGWGKAGGWWDGWWGLEGSSVGAQLRQWKVLKEHAGIEEDTEPKTERM